MSILDKCHQIHGFPGRIFRHSVKRWGGKAAGPPLGLLIHYERTASQQASATTYQGVELLYRQGQAQFNMGQLTSYPYFLDMAAHSQVQ